MTTRQSYTFDEDPYQTTGSAVTKASPVDTNFYFLCAVVVMGIVGTAANGAVVYAMVASKQHKNYVLIFNQNVLDLVSCFFLSVSSVAKLCNIRLSGTSGYWLCLVLLSDASSWGPFLGSLINLAAITVERYVKVVHSTWAKQKLRKWTEYSTIALAWIGGIGVAVAVTVPTSIVVDGVCYPAVHWNSRVAQTAFGIWYFLSFYVVILLVFVFFYWRILIAIRHHARVIAAQNAAAVSGAAQTHHSKQIQIKIIKTMLLVSLLFVVTWTPGFVYTLLVNIHLNLTVREFGFSAVLIIGYLYICINPIIYATHFDPVKSVLIGFIPCKKTTQPVEIIEIA